MARLGVTYQDVSDAAVQLLGQGRQPTIEQIRNVLGTGSTTTIANHLRKWRAEQDGSTSVSANENIPQEFISVMKGLWQRLQAHADTQIEVVEREVEQTELQLRQDLEKYKKNNHRWQKLYYAWFKEKDKLFSVQMDLEQQIIALKFDHSALMAKLDAQERHLAEKQFRIEELTRLHTLSQENLEHYRESTRVQRLIEQRKFSDRLKEIDNNLNCANQDKINLQNKIDEVIHINIAIKKLNDEMKYDLNTQEQNYDILQKKFDQQNSILAEQLNNCAVLETKLALAIEDIIKLKNENQLLLHEKLEILQQKAQLEGVNKQMQAMLELG